jgi:5-methylcytosine-specific restriction protein B
MQRRFEFEYVDAESDLCPANYGAVDLRKVLTTINRRLAVLLGPNYRIGHASLMKEALDDVVTRQGWKKQPDAPLRAIAHVWNTHIIPTILDYFHNDFEKARGVAGCAESRGVAYELFDKMRPDAALLRSLPDEYDLADARSFIPARWWNPQFEAWNPDRFAAFLKALVR